MAGEDRVWGRVLSIQSHTVHGYVGNKAAVLPLQLLGFDVDPVNSVQFSNHTGYENGWEGQVLGGEQLDALVEGLRKNGLLAGYSHLLTGYIGSTSFLRSVLGALKALRGANPGLTYFCDPVLGDEGKLYVPKELVAVYRQEVLPVANVLTPNQFELELLSEVSVVDMASCRVALDALHAKGVGVVILTSCDFGDQSNQLTLLASVRREGAAPKLIRAVQPRISGHYTGTGDLIAALLLAWTTREANDLEAAVAKACASMNAVVSRTRASIEDGSNPNGEIRLVQSRRDIEQPDVAAARVSVSVVQ